MSIHPKSARRGNEGRIETCGVARAGPTEEGEAIGLGRRLPAGTVTEGRPL